MHGKATQTLIDSVAGLMIEEWLAFVACGRRAAARSAAPATLLAYAPALAARHANAAEVVAFYAEEGPHGETAVSATLFEDLEVTKTGHKRLFERWFADH